MARFRFRLQPVLDVRERALDARRRDLASMQRAHSDAQSVLAGLVADRAAQRDTLTRDHRAFDVDALRAAYAHLAYLDRAIDDQTVRVATAWDEVERAQLAVVAANTDRKVLETLRTRRFDAFTADAVQHEQRESDDQNARRFSRARHERGDDE